MRIGCVKFLNARPLIRGWPNEVIFDTPSALCRMLAQAELDVALASSVEFLRNPIYRIVDDVSISSDGEVYSVIVAHRGELSQIEEIELDPASETSVALLRYLLAERRISPRFLHLGSMGCQPVVSGSLSDTSATRAQLLIGDKAIRFREQHSEFEFWDLGAEWKRRTNLPFVYALWLVRPELKQNVADQLRALRDENLRKIDMLISHETEFDPEFCRRYFRDNVRFGFGEREKAGLSKFAELCADLDLIPKRELALDLL